MCPVFQDINQPQSFVSFHQVPQDEWASYPGGGKDDEIPCRRMRSSSYVKAMGAEESGESDSSPKTSPQKSARPDALIKAIIRPKDLVDSQRCGSSKNHKSVHCSKIWLRSSRKFLETYVSIYVSRLSL
ncbi:hypothetical protein XENOCAPTIV_010703 [Xenoophorus captivus]|uniref:Uncharacterized protein n=1 Tax=Xenoophorus captivus TaxID=1517983 RepID=A0ABV0RS01_9TELE